MGEIKDLISAAELCGALVGDGWIQSNRKNMFLAGNLTEDRDYYDNNIACLFRKISIPLTPKSFPYWKVYGVSLHAKEKIEIFINLGIPLGKKSDTVEIPLWILSSDKNVKLAFIRGLFDTDGGVWCQKDYTKYASEFNSKHHVKFRLRFTSVSQKLQTQLQKLLTSLDFGSRLRVLRNRGSKTRPNNKDVYIVALDKIRDLHRFFEEVSPSNERHTTKYLIWKQFGFCPPNTSIEQRKDILKKKINPYDLY